MFIYEGHPSRLQSRQKELSTVLWPSERFNHTVDTHAWKPLGQLREPVLPFSAAEQQAVQDLLNQDVHNEVSLTNQVFFVRHPHRRGTKIGAGEAALASEWRTIRDLLVRPKLVVLPPTIPRRPCCIFAPVTPFGSNIVDPARPWSSQRSRRGQRHRVHPDVQVSWT